MDREEYLRRTYRRLELLADDRLFTTSLAQIRARAIQEELLAEQPEVGFTFDTARVWKYCDYLFSESTLLLRENSGDEDFLFQSARTAAEAFEFLSKFADEPDREILLLNSAICYHIAGYQANARCLAKLVQDNYLRGHTQGSHEDSRDALLTWWFRHALVSFLERDIPELTVISSEALSSIRQLQEALTKELAEGTTPTSEMFGLVAHAYFQQALSDFARYCVDGETHRFSDALAHIQKTHEYFQKAGDATLGTIASELRSVLELFDQRSTWSTLRRHAGEIVTDPVWQVYLRNLAFEESVVEFWASQLRAIRSDILTSDDGFVVQMPTSAGKTLIAELSILATLTSMEQARCLYIAPYRALAREVEANLGRTLGAVGYRVSNLMGGFELDAFEDFLVRESDVLVATPEKTDLFLRAHPTYFDDVCLIVLDEGHIVDEGVPSPKELGEVGSLPERLGRQGSLGRGPLFELLITRLRRRLPNARFVSLSAVMPQVNAGDFVEWLCNTRPEPLRIDRSRRPSRQLIAKFEWVSPRNGELEYLSLPALPDGRSPFVPYFIQRKQYRTGEFTETGRPRRQSWPDISSKVQTTAMLAAQFARTGPVLIFCAQPGHVRLVVRNLIIALRYLEASQELPHDRLRYIQEPELESFHLARQWLGQGHVLTKALHRGVGLHYGPLPESLRQAIEDDFKAGELQILVSTNTLAQGVNMPIKTALIYSLERRWGEGEDNASQVAKRDFWNICGRAGRAGKETEGHVVFVVTSNLDRRLLDAYADYANLEEIDSALYKLLQLLVERRIDQDALMQYLDAHVLTMLVEEIVDTEDEDAIRHFLKSSLVGVQAARNDIDLSPLISAIQRTSAWVVKAVPDPELRRVFSSTGLTVRSCQALEEAAELLAASVTEELLEVEQDNAWCNSDLLRASFAACSSLPEMALRRAIDYRGPEDEFEILAQWVAGQPVDQLRSRLWDPQHGEALGEYIADRITYKLPWGFNGFLRILAFKLGLDYARLPLAWQHLPSMVKFGVNNAIACWPCSLAVSSRELALQLAAKYQPTNGVSFLDFLKWMTNLPIGVIMHELDALDFEKQRLVDEITRIVPDTRLLQFIRTGSDQLDSPVRGIPFEGRDAVAAQVEAGDRLVLELEPDNPYDPYAVRVVFQGSHIGYVQRDKARVVSRELQMGRAVAAAAKTIKPPTDTHPFPWIDMTIQFA